MDVRVVKIALGVNVNNMKTVFKAAIILPTKENSLFGYVDPHEFEVEDDFYANFKWDKPIRMDFYNPPQMVFLSTNKQQLADMLYGAYCITAVDCFFSEEAKVRQQEKIRAAEGDETIVLA